MSRSVVEFVRATPDHVDPIASRMREADRLELMAGSGRLPHDALAFSLGRSRYAITGLVDGRPEAMFGVGSLTILPAVGSPWLLGTDELRRIPRTFVQESRAWVDAMLQHYSLLRNVVDDRHDESKRWLRWLGFTMSDPVIMGRELRPFRLFEKASPYV